MVSLCHLNQISPNTSPVNNIMTSSNGSIFLVTVPLCGKPPVTGDGLPPQRGSNVDLLCSFCCQSDELLNIHTAKIFNCSLSQNLSGIFSKTAWLSVVVNKLSSPRRSHMTAMAFRFSWQSSGSVCLYDSLQNYSKVYHRILIKWCYISGGTLVSEVIHFYALSLRDLPPGSLCKTTHLCALPL